MLAFLIAVLVGLTGIGAGSFSVPVLMLIVGLPAVEAVGTAFVFAAVLRLIASPFYLAGRQVHWRYLRLLLLGAVPGLIFGMVALRLLSAQGRNSEVTILLGVLLTISSSVTFIPRAQNRSFVAKNVRWLAWLALPVGAEAGFSSAGAGALGTVLLLNYSEMSPAQVIGTDLVFGFVLAAIGSGVHWTLGTINQPVLLQFLAGGVPGIVFGCLLSKRVPARKLRTIVALIALCAGLQLVWTGSRSFANRREPHVKHPAALPSSSHTVFRAPLGWAASFMS